MPNASPRDTRAGWDIFIQSGSGITRDELNEKLGLAGYNPVSDRTLRHYHNLMNAGYTRYISINRFDVSRAAEPYESPSSKARYGYRAVDVGVQVTFAKSSSLFEAFGRAIEVGDVGAVLIFGDETVRQGLDKLRPTVGEMVSIRFLEAGRSVAGRVVDTDIKASPSRVEIEYSQLTSIAEIATGAPLSRSQARFVLIPYDTSESTIDLAGRRLYLFFELIEGIRAVVNSAGAEQAEPVYADPPVLTELSIASPVVIVLQLADAAKHLFPYGLVTGVLLAAGKAVDKRKVWYEGSKAKFEAQLAEQKVKQAMEKTTRGLARTAQSELDVRVKAAEVEMKEAEAEVAALQAELKRDLITKLHERLPGSTLSAETVSALIDSEFSSVVQKLADSGIAEIRKSSPPKKTTQRR